MPVLQGGGQKGDLLRGGGVNSVIERTYELEKRAALVTEQIKVANHRIDDLEHISIEKEK